MSRGAARIRMVGWWNLHLSVWWYHVPIGLGGLLLAWLWYQHPPTRMAGVADPLVAALIGALWIGSATVWLSAWMQRWWSFGRVLIVVAAAAAGAFGCAFAAITMFAPIVARVSPCSPAIAVGQAAGADWASMALPFVAWMGWHHALLAPFPPQRDDDDRQLNGPMSTGAMHWRASRRLPWFVFASLAWAGVALGTVRLRHPPLTEVSAATLAQAPIRLLAAAPEQRSNWLATVEATRMAAEAAAAERASQLDLDGAFTATGDAVCGHLLPGRSPTKEVVDLRARLVRLGAGTKLAAETPLDGKQVGVLVSFLHFAAAGGSAPICPNFYPPAAGGADILIEKSKQIQTTPRPVSLAGRLLFTQFPVARRDDNAAMESAWRFAAPAQAIGAGVLPELIERFGRAPDIGPTTIGMGASCAVWQFGSMGVRVGPEVKPGKASETVSDRDPLWITCYSQESTAWLAARYKSTNSEGGWDPHGCSKLTPSAPKRASRIPR